jgi:hypothetical protein
MKKKSGSAEEEQGVLTEAQIDQTVSRLVESFRAFLVLLMRLSRERVDIRWPR